MKLYVSPGACSMSCHIAFEESGLAFEPQIATDDGVWQNIAQLNPQGAVPVLVMDDGKVLTQNIAILNFVAEKAPQAGLLPKAGTLERAQAFQWLSWVASDLHPAFGPLFNPSMTDEARQAQVSKVETLLSQAERHMEGRSYVAGDQFSVADAYLFTVYGWAGHLKISTSGYRNMNAFAARIAERPAVHAVMKREGLLD
jgi:glutathione S-transferase